MKTKLLNSKDYPTHYPRNLHDLIVYVVNKEAEATIPDMPRELHPDCKHTEFKMTPAVIASFSKQIVKSILP